MVIAFSIKKRVLLIVRVGLNGVFNKKNVELRRNDPNLHDNANNVERNFQILNLINHFGV